jgi:hypothetical protein
MAKLRTATKGQFENKPTEDIPPAFRAAYKSPDPKLPKSLDALRAEREYSRAVVDEFVAKACDEQYLPPGATMMLFVLMCTKHHSAFSHFGGAIRMKLMAMYRFWDESHPWVRANILYEMRERLYHQHHLIFCRAFAAKARQYDKVREEENKLPAEAEVLDVQEKNENHERGGIQGARAEEGAPDDASGGVRMAVRERPSDEERDRAGHSYDPEQRLDSPEGGDRSGDRT